MNRTKNPPTSRVAPLIPITDCDFSGQNAPAVNARELHSFLGVRSNFRDWIRNRINDFEFVENHDFSTIAKNLATGGRTKEYFLTLSMAKELCMVERSARGKEARLYFIECERVAKEAAARLQAQPARTALPDFSDPVAAARAWADEKEKALALEARITLDAPKVEFAEDVVASEEEFTVTATAKVLNIAPRKLFDWLRMRGYLYKQSSQAMQVSINQGLMVSRFTDITRSDGRIERKARAHVTGKGLYTFYKKLRGENLISRNSALELTA